MSGGNIAAAAGRVAPSVAAAAYRAADAAGEAKGAAGADFSGVLARSLGNVEATGRSAESEAAQAIAGDADITAVTTAVAKAELALQTTMAVRDRVVQAWQDIMRMPI
jgi:flagellar hook-basal body complex protein FliE